MSDSLSRRRPILVLDFDGVIHAYSSKFTTADEILDGPIPGALDFIDQMSQTFDVQILSSRSSTADGRRAMSSWLDRNWVRHFGANYSAPTVLFPEHKPPAFLTLDDRAITFTGEFPTVKELFSFRQWQKGK